MYGDEVLPHPPERASARRARHFVASLFDDMDAPCAQDTVLLVSELVTNTVTHAGTPVTVDVQVRPDRVRVEVADDDPRVPAPLDVGPESTTGRGLDIVRRQATRWGVTPTSHGKSVWFEIDY
jgi:anti-sigma regulatory factor (Ser/Thr protein kinase)